MKLTFKPVAAAMSLLLASVAVQAAGPYNPVTDARLQNPEPRNWLVTRGNYQGWGYSPLEKINTANVGKLQQAWSFTTGETDQACCSLPTLAATSLVVHDRRARRSPGTPYRQ